MHTHIHLSRDVVYVTLTYSIKCFIHADCIPWKRKNKRIKLEYFKNSVNKHNLTNVGMICSRQLLSSSITWPMATSCSTCILSSTTDTTHSKPLLSAPSLWKQFRCLFKLTNYDVWQSFNITYCNTCIKWSDGR